MYKIQKVNKLTAASEELGAKAESPLARVPAHRATKGAHRPHKPPLQ